MTVLEAVKQSKTSTLMQKGSIEAVQKMLKPSEDVLYAMTANICTDAAVTVNKPAAKEQAYVVIVITNQRVLYVQKVLANLSSAFIPLWEIRSAKTFPQGKYWCLQILGITKNLLVIQNRKPIQAFHDALQNALAKQSSPTAAPQTNATQAETLDVEQLKKLKELYDAGILTEEEFSAKKAQILGL